MYHAYLSPMRVYSDMLYDNSMTLLNAEQDFNINEAD